MSSINASPVWGGDRTVSRGLWCGAGKSINKA